jgi:hypothetical protein
MLITEAEVRVILGLASTITDQERALLTMVIPAACGKIAQHLGYDPEQGVQTELQPRLEISGGPAMQGPNTDYDYISNTSNTRAVLRPYASQGRTLQLNRLPVRAVTSLYLNQAAYAGQAADPFPSTCLMTQGSDYWIEFDEPLASDAKKGISRSGCLFSQGIWPVTPHCVRVTYRAGYSPTELQGRATADEVASDGTITQAGVNASGILRAALLIAVKQFHQWSVYAKKSIIGFQPGPIQSESLGDYSYSQGMVKGIADMTMDMPAEAIRELEPFVNYGRLRG